MRMFRTHLPGRICACARLADSGKRAERRNYTVPRGNVTGNEKCSCKDADVSAHVLLASSHLKGRDYDASLEMLQADWISKAKIFTKVALSLVYVSDLPPAAGTDRLPGSGCKCLDRPDRPHDR